MRKNIFCFVFFFFSFVAFATEKHASAIEAGLVKTRSVKTATMHATGKVIEISGSTVKIERTVKGEAEAMTFALEKPFGDVAVNDFVKIDYVEKEGVLTALKMNKIRLKERSVHADSVQSAPVKK